MKNGTWKNTELSAYGQTSQPRIMKYFQTDGTTIDAYIPQPFFSKYEKGNDLHNVEGEFKALSLVGKGKQAIGLPGLFPYTKSKEGNPVLLPQLQAALNCLKPTTIYFWGDSDTFANWRFAVSAVAYRKTLDPVITLKLPRIHLNEPKGVDDCIEELKEGFDAWCNAKLADAIQVDSQMTADDLLLILIGRETMHMRTLKGEMRSKIERFLVECGMRFEDSPTAFADFKKLIKKAGLNWTVFSKSVEKRKNEIADEAKRKYLENFKADNATNKTVNGFKPKIVLPGADRLVSEFGSDLASALSSGNKFFNFNGILVQISEIERKDAEGKTHKIIGFSPVHPHGFIPDFEQYVETGVFTKKGFIKESLPKSASEALIKSNSFKGSFPCISGLSEIPLPYFAGDELKFASYGYNKELGIYVLDDKVKILPMSLDEAWSILLDLLGEFCFLDIVDFARAVAFLLTMLLRLIIGEERTMMFLVDANRQGAGKDYLLGLIILLATGRRPFYYPPCNNEEEWRKRIFAGLIAGERAILISNQKGHLDSGALEHTLTSPYISDRILGQSKNVTLPNTATYGISGNGLTFSDDMARRICHIRLEFYKEDQASRKFKHSDLYTHAIENRQRILSALTSLVVHWVASGRPKGRAIPSFVRWSQTVGGILTCCGFPDPFMDRANVTPALEIGGSREDKDIKILVEKWHTQHAASSVNAGQLRTLADQHTLFGWMELQERRGQVKFSKMLTQRANREIGNFRIKVDTGGKTAQFYLEGI